MTEHGTILRGGRIIDPANGTDTIADLCIVGDRIADPTSAPGDAAVIDVSGQIVCPGLIDLHVHLREPGQTHKEDIASGSRAAAAGGFTTIVAMPNTSPPIDSPERLDEAHDLIRQKAVVRVLQTACLTSRRGGGALTDIEALADANAVALTDDGGCVPDAGLMREAMRRAKQAGRMVIDHCEDTTVSRGAPMNAGAVASRLGMRGQPNLAEELMVARDVLIAADLDAPVHIQHISAARGVEIVRQARQCGIAVSAEVTPHHLCLTDDWCESHGPNAKMNPPLRTEADRQALIQGLLDGTIEAIATDHAPHSADEKAVGIENAPFGIVGLETAVPLTLEYLVYRGILELPHWVALFTAGPRKILGLDAGTLSVGAPADITIIDPNAEHTLRTADFVSRSHNCPYDGITCHGKVMRTIIAGRQR